MFPVSGNQEIKSYYNVFDIPLQLQIKPIEQLTFF
jgi:hypothetical protein